VRSRALWAVPAGVAVVAGLAVTSGAEVAALALAALLVLVAVARWLWRRERPEGLAVRAWPVDVAIAVALAVGLVILAVSVPR
jgi:hypothetical protein